MIQNYDKISKLHTKYEKNYTLWKNSYLFNND
jgi:hypothetical protein